MSSIFILNERKFCNRLPGNALIKNASHVFGHKPGAIHEAEEEQSKVSKVSMIPDAATVYFCAHRKMLLGRDNILYKETGGRIRFNAAIQMNPAPPRHFRHHSFYMR